MSTSSFTEIVESYVRRYSVNCRSFFTKDSKIEMSSFMDLFKENHAIWSHDGDPNKPHVDLGGEVCCSDGYVDCLKVLNRPLISEFLACQLLFCLEDLFIYLHTKVDWVICSSEKEIMFAGDLARLINARVGFTEKDRESDTGMKWDRWVIGSGETVLQIEGVVGNGRNLNLARRTVKRDNPFRAKWLPFVGALVHCPSKLPFEEHNGMKLTALIELEIKKWSSKTCPLCKRGSKSIPFKGNESIFLKEYI